MKIQETNLDFKSYKKSKMVYLVMMEIVYIIPDRQLAIKFITEITQPGDVVLLAGK